MASDLRDIGISENETDRNLEAANLVDGLFAIARSIGDLALAVDRLGHNQSSRAMSAKALRLPAVMEATGLARATIYKYISMGTFPLGRTRGGIRVQTWDADEIEIWKRGQWKA